MCGRYTQRKSARELAERFGIQNAQLDLTPRYNIAPTQEVVGIVQSPDAVRQSKAFRWGLIPRRANNNKFAAKLINARKETVSTKPSYRESFRTKRCIIPADGYYEWLDTDQGKLPIFFRRKDDGLFAFAGIWDTWRDPFSPGKPPVHTCSIITVEANALSKDLHPRMPAILLREHEALWLDQTEHNPAHLLPLLNPYPHDDLTVFPVSPKVNSARSEGRELIERVKQLG